MTLYKTILIGLLGSFLMFLGDMTLYYDPNDYLRRLVQLNIFCLLLIFIDTLNKYEFISL